MVYSHQFYTATFFAFVTNRISAHSWIECSDYRGDKTNYDPTKCFGFPRGKAQKRPNAAFGVDTGFENRSNNCQAAFGSAYTAQFPKATYTPGQNVCLAWPSKNHVSDTCTNPFIPDRGNFVFASGVNPTSDPSLSSFMKDEVANLGVNPAGQIAHKGYQNCPAFCENMDKALCTQCFTFPQMAPGDYVFLWRWEFNVGEFYITCWDATVKASSGATTTSSPTTTPRTTTLISSTNAGTTSTLTATTVTTKKPTTTTTTTKAPVGSGSCLSGVSLKLTATEKWTGNIKSSYDLINNSGKDVCSVVVTIPNKSKIVKIWNMKDNGNNFGLPSFKPKLQNGDKFNWGYIYGSDTAPTLSLCAKSC